MVRYMSLKVLIITLKKNSKGIEISIIENSNLEIKNSDKYYFANGFFDLKIKNLKQDRLK